MLFTSNGGYRRPEKIVSGVLLKTILSEKEREKEIERDRQTGRQADRQIDRQIDIQIDRQIDRYTERQKKVFLYFLYQIDHLKP